MAQTKRTLYQHLLMHLQGLEKKKAFKSLNCIKIKSTFCNDLELIVWETNPYGGGFFNQNEVIESGKTNRASNPRAVLEIYQEFTGAELYLFNILSK